MTQNFPDKMRPPPEPPRDDECCGRGCEPCIFDYYERALLRWQKSNDQGAEN